MSEELSIQKEERLEQLILTRTVRLNALVHGIVFGLISGTALFVATNWLLIKGGPMSPEGEPIIGAHLALLGQFFFGYDVTFRGSLLGFVYGFVFGFAIGFFTAWLYNRIVDFRQRGQEI